MGNMQGSAYISRLVNNNMFVSGINGSYSLGGGPALTTITQKQTLSANNVRYVSLCTTHSLLITLDNKLYFSGYNAYGCAGDGLENQTSTFVYRIGWTYVMDDVEYCFAGNDQSLAVKKDGSLWAWGRNNFGQITNGSTLNVAVPKKIADDVKMATSGDGFVMYLTRKGDVYFSGSNQFGQAGIGTLNTPLPWTKTFSGAKYIHASGADSYVIANNGDLYIAGRNSNYSHGEPGNNGVKPTYILRGTNVKKVQGTITNTTIYMKEDNTLWGAGNGTYGTLGNGASGSQINGFIQAYASFTDIVDFYLGQDFSLVLRANNRIYACGYNQDNRTGYLTTQTQILVPTLIAEDVKNLPDGKEPSSNKYLINDMGKYKTYKNGYWQEVGTVVGEAEYLTHGMEDLSKLSDSVVRQLTGTIFDIYEYSTETPMDMSSNIGPTLRNHNSLASSGILHQVGNVLSTNYANQAFHRESSTNAAYGGSAPYPCAVGWWGVNPGRIVNRYSFVFINASYFPKAWQFEGWDGNAWVTLHTQTPLATAPATGSTFMSPEFPNDVPYVGYRLLITQSFSTSYAWLANFCWYEKPKPKRLLLVNEPNYKFKYKVDIIPPETQIREMLSDWTFFTNSEALAVVTVPKEMIRTSDPYQLIISVLLSNNVDFEKPDTVTLQNNAPTINIDQKGMLFTVTMNDADGDEIRYRVLVNDQQIFPEFGLTQPFASPVVFQQNFNSRLLIPEVFNKLTIEAQDSFLKWETISYQFKGEYTGLMFMDSMERYYSTDLGDILRYLDFGAMQPGQAKVAKVLLRNTNGFSVRNVKLTVDRANLPPNTTVTLSTTNTPFTPFDELIFEGPMAFMETYEFYIRLSYGITIQSGGEFDIYVRGEPV